MKRATRIRALIFALLASTVSAYAQSPHEQLERMVVQLQKATSDNALREKIIMLATKLKPAPAIPEEANRAFVRGNVFAKEAKDVSGYDLAISSYREALRIAPWWGDAYFNLAAVLESSRRFDEAITSIKLYLTSLPAGSTEAREAQNHIYAIEAKSELATKQAATAARAKEDVRKRPQALADRLQQEFGNRRLMSNLFCYIADGRSNSNKCNDSDTQGSTWRPGAREGSYSWMPREVRQNSSEFDFRSLNLRHQFRLDPGNQGQILMEWTHKSEGSWCGLVNGADIKDIKWRLCSDGDYGGVMAIVFSSAADGRAVIDFLTHCDAARYCQRNREVLE